MSSDHYLRTVQFPIVSLTAKKAGMLNRAMKDYLRARRLCAKYFQQNDAFDFNYDDKTSLRKSISNHERVHLHSRTIYPAISELEQNYKEYEKDGNAAEPWPTRADTLGLEGQVTYIFYDNGRYYINVPTGKGNINLPLITTEADYHSKRIPHPETIPPEGRRTGIKFSELEPSAFPADTLKLATSTLHRYDERQFGAHLVFHIEKEDTEEPDDPRYLVGVDRGRNEVFRACVYDREQDHVVDWGHFDESGDEIERYMDEYAERIYQVQSAGKLNKMDRLRTRRFRYKEQKDHEAANQIVDLAKQFDDVAIVLEKLTGIGNGGWYNREKRRFSDWSFGRLRELIAEKAEVYSIPVESIDPRHTSQQCSRCGSMDTRRESIHFECRECGYEQHADDNAAVNVAKRFTSEE